ncbi:ATP-binding protein [Collimonas humicola]|uniref:ATP-binding protein n=1 Tax=Collimonas humicola TaxID=2825886 RepID=UPI001B8C70E1|nr:AAA family ATPase [Collimonas humicola]
MLRLSVDNEKPLPLPQARALSEEENWSCLLAQLERIDLMVQRALHRLQSHPDDKHNMQALVQAPEEVEALMAQPQGRPHWAVQEDADAVADQEEPAMESGPIARHSRLGQLIERFGLSPFERDVLLLALLPWFDARYSVLFSFIQDDTRKRLPTIDFALNVLCRDGMEKTAQLVSLMSQAPLVRHGLLTLKSKSDAAGQWADTVLQTDKELYHYLAGHETQRARDCLPPLLAQCAQWLKPPENLPDRYPDLTARIVQFCFAGDIHVASPKATPVLLLRAHAGRGRGVAVATAAATADRQVLNLDLELLPKEDEDALHVLSLALRETRLRAGCLVLRSLPAMAEARRWLFAQFSARIVDHGLPLVCLTEPHAPQVWLGDLPQLLLDMPARSLAADEALLRAQLKKAGAAVSTEATLDLAALVKRFHLSADTLTHTLHEADLYRAQRSPAALLAIEDLYAAFRLRSQQNFGKLAQRIAPMRDFDDLIISDDLQQQLKEILAAIKHKDQVLAQGFGRKVSYGIGISALFHGDSGTGKTMVAEVLAGALGVDLIKIDLSTVVNKYIGETEKNISRIFDLAAADAGVLFFDEADALFGKRSETKDAHDRHANIEVSYLLQRLETYPGLVVLATNNRSHLDEAFTRRLTFITRFPFPDATLRERMWRSIWPPQVALADDIDFAALARKAIITGANIRNTALLATWLAAEEGAPCVGSGHVARALQRELVKMGRLAL